jgi:hypothetical protein
MFRLVRPAALMAATALMIASAWAAGPLDRITHVHFTRGGDILNATIIGHNFGTPPVALPCNACTIPELSFEDLAVFPPGINEPLTITSWTDTAIAVSGITGHPADAYWVAVTNDTTKHIAVHSGNLPSNLSHPVITNVSFTGTGKTATASATPRGVCPAPA